MTTRNALQDRDARAVRAHRPRVHKVARAGLVLAALAGLSLVSSACGGGGGGGGHTTTTKAPGY